MEAGMMHLGDDTLFTVAGGAGSAADLEHLTDCPRCRARVEEWRLVRSGLSELEANRIEPGELHLLGALFRARGPLPAGRTQLVARLLRTAPLSPVAVRGQATPRLSELEAGPYHLTMEVSGAGAAGPHRLYGQLLRDGAPAGTGEIVLTDQRGRSSSTVLDELGEFELAGLEPGTYRAVLALPGERVLVEPIAVGAGDDA
jgi:hypothetical protein